MVKDVMPWKLEAGSFILWVEPSSGKLRACWGNECRSGFRIGVYPVPAAFEGSW